MEGLFGIARNPRILRVLETVFQRISRVKGEKRERAERERGRGKRKALRTRCRPANLKTRGGLCTPVRLLSAP